MAFEIRKSTETIKFPKAKASKQKDYLSFIHKLPCIVTGTNVVEAAHLSYSAPEYGHYGRGKSSKASDRWVLPLSPQEHRKQHSMNEREYWQRMRMNPHIIALTIWGLWTEHGEDAEEYASALIMSQIFASGRL